MNNKSLILLLSAALLFEGCTSDELGSGQSLDNKSQSSLGWNGLGWNGLGWNGLGWNGLGWNGLGWNGLGWNGLGWNGLGWNGLGFSNTSVPADWGLDSWINNSDADNDGNITAIDRELRLNALSYWTSCACASGTSLVWKGNNPYSLPPNPSDTRALPGGFNLAPTWCTGSGTIPVEEQQAVSACIFARVNAKGIHNAISMRGYEPSLKLVDNEKLFMAYPEGQFFGNLWADPKAKFTDPKDKSTYTAATANACFYGWGNAQAQLAHDLQLIVGRSCEWDSCGGPMKTTQACDQDGAADGSQTWGVDGGGTPAWISDPPVYSGGLNNSSVNGYPDNVTGQKYASWHNNSWRKMSVFLGDWADLEIDNWKAIDSKCGLACPQVDSCECYDKYCAREQNLENGDLGPPTCDYPSDCNICSTMVSPVLKGKVRGASADCEPASACVRGRKLTALDADYWMHVMFLRPFDLVSGAMVTGTANPHKAGSLLFRYTNGSGAAASIQIKDLIRNSMINGHGFAPTAGWDDYQNKVVYPIYPGRVSFTDMTPGIDLAIAADPTSPAFPHLDYVQMWVGPPFGVPAREQYDDGVIGKQLIPEDGKSTIKTSIKIGADNFASDFKQVRKVRFRIITSHPKLAELRMSVTHGTSKATIAGESLDADGWSTWQDAFGNDDPMAAVWQFQVLDQQSNGVSGVLMGVALEMQQ